MRCRRTYVLNKTKNLFLEFLELRKDLWYVEELTFLIISIYLKNSSPIWFTPNALKKKDYYKEFVLK